MSGPSNSCGKLFQPRSAHARASCWRPALARSCAIARDAALAQKRRVVGEFEEAPFVDLLQLEELRAERFGLGLRAAAGLEMQPGDFAQRVAEGTAGVVAFPVGEDAATHGVIGERHGVECVALREHIPNKQDRSVCARHEATHVSPVDEAAWYGERSAYGFLQSFQIGRCIVAQRRRLQPRAQVRVVLGQPPPCVNHRRSSADRAQNGRADNAAASYRWRI